ncbi:phage major tail tube protein [Pseudoalteromonas rubra]|uniref:Phage major tail tube protein n=1 Tax=Pseudoalteromonas rubra TaxID=43658 RepID=A0A4Q7EII8_9GAMM|nr:phage major tail tube protein [Pseudoalteromonas rubra]RZM83781.1 phage major tail tube protein [Pseudoalteromonas rubra]TMP30375.1 phage major tail tube protein [Pseudoalteromonas rubra]TMP35398.1 phage major tail tube protein [Pseudoalteromonas rubra]
MAMSPKILKKFKLFVDGKGYLGIADEIQLPKVTVKTREVTSGFQAPIELDVGQLEKLEGSITLLEYNADMLKLLGDWSGATTPLTARGAIQAQGQPPQPVVVTLEGYFKEVDMGNWKDGEEAKLTMQYTVQKYKLEINNEVIYEIDLYNDVRKINGTDQMALLRAAIGA